MTPEQKKKLLFAIKVEKQRRADKEEYDPTKGMSKMDKFVAGYGKAAHDVGKFLLPKKVELALGMNQDEALDAPLMSTGAGMAGNLVGGMVTTAPLGMGAGMAMGAGARALTTAPRLARALAARPVQAAVQGAIEGAATAPEGAQGGGAGVGAAVGGALSAVPVVGGKLVRALGRGPLKMTDEAQELTRVLRHTSGDPKAFIPLSQSLPEDSLARAAYSGIAANIPGGRVRSQYQNILDTFRGAGLFRAAPVGVQADEIFKSYGGKYGPELIQHGVARLQHHWGKAFDDVTSRAFKMPRQFSMFKRVNDLLDEAYQVKLPVGNSTVKGSELTELRKMVKELEWKTPGVRDKKLLQIAVQRIDETIKNQLPADVARKYAKNQRRWKYYRDMIEAIKAEPKAAKFLPKDMAEAASTRAGEKGLGGGGGKLQHMGNLGVASLKDFPSRQGIFQILAAYGGVNALGGAAGFMAGNENDTTAQRLMKVGAGVAAPSVLARAVTNPRFQRGLVEGSKRFAKAGNRMDECAGFLRNGGFTKRQIAVVLATQEE